MFFGENVATARPTVAASKSGAAFPTKGEAGLLD